MYRLGIVLLVTTIVCTAIVPESMARQKKTHLGVFGTINGKRFVATSRDGAGDACVSGIYRPNDGIVVFAAVECKGKRRRQGVAVKKNYKVLAMGCTNFDTSVNTLAPPYEIPCVASAYTEYKTGRFRQPVSMLNWLSSLVLLDPLMPTSNLHMRIDAFDGTNVRGAIFGVFDTPQPPATGTVAISGEVTFDFPFQIQ
jgi:hypothetical protein